jgi:CubicO group peptidase (beta-lactamase class C family)
MILNKGILNGKRILSENSISEMQINRITKEVTKKYAPAEAGDFGYGFGEWVMESSTKNNLSKAISRPGLFGSFPWIDNEKKYAGFLMTFNLNNKGRNEKYKTLKTLTDEVIQ